MLTPTPLPQNPAAAAAVLAEALTTLGGDRAPPREAALAAFRRHLARIQTHVQNEVRAGRNSPACKPRGCWRD